jgi:hypothetical protein
MIGGILIFSLLLVLDEHAHTPVLF